MNYIRHDYAAPDVASAICSGYFKQVRFLLDFGYSPDHACEGGKTPLILCCFLADDKWRVGLARNLLEKNASLAKRDAQGLTALHYACLNQKTDLVHLFLASADFDINKADKYGNTPLMYAAFVGNADITIAMLSALQKCGKSIDTTNLDHMSPLMLAYKRGHSEVAEVLMEAGADFSIADKAGKSVAQYASDANKIKQADEENAFLRAMRSKIRFDEVDKWRDHMERVKSAPPKARVLADTGHDKPEVIETIFSKLESPDIISAKKIDKHNKPQFVFNQDPVTLFGRDHLDEKYMRAWSVKRRPASAKASPSIWSDNFREILVRLEDQFAPSFRNAAKPAVSDMLFSAAQLRNLHSPTASDSASDVASRHSRRESSRNERAGRDEKRRSRKLTTIVQSAKAVADFAMCDDVFGAPVNRRKKAVAGDGKPALRPPSRVGTSSVSSEL